jgi:prepilin-type N-terminal cleavage/methylation domain-containing protein
MRKKTSPCCFASRHDAGKIYGNNLSKKCLLNDCGFTLIEIIIVLSLMLLVVGLSAVYYANSLPKFRLNATTREVTADMRKARALARIQNEQQSVFFDLDKRTFGVTSAKKHEIPEGISIRIIHPLTGEITKGSAFIIFYPTGGSEGYSIILSNERQTQTIQMDPVVGAAVVR